MVANLGQIEVAVSRTAANIYGSNFFRSRIFEVIAVGVSFFIPVWAVLYF